MQTKGSSIEDGTLKTLRRGQSYKFDFRPHEPKIRFSYRNIGAITKGEDLYVGEEVLLKGYTHFKDT